MHGTTDPSRPTSDLARSTFQLLAIGALLLASVWIVRPFLIASVWAVTIAVATWPLLRLLEVRLGGRRRLAAAAMTLALLMLLVVPLYGAIDTLVRNAKHIGQWSESVATLAIPQPPTWLGAIPLVGGRLTARWQQLAATSPAELVARLEPFARTLALWFAGQVGSIGLLVVQLLLTAVIVALLYSNGEEAAHGARRFARRLAGSRGDEALQLAAQAVRAVALGVVVTAIVQAALGGIGLAIAGVPFAAMLTAVMFILAVAQVGAAPVLLAAAIWVYLERGGIWGTGFLVWAIVVGTLDNFLRPFLIKRGADLPMLLIFAGVIGGLIAFGIVGLFIGPVVLAVGYTLLVEWVSESDRSAEDRSL